MSHKQQYEASDLEYGTDSSARSSGSTPVSGTGRRWGGNPARHRSRSTVCTVGVDARWLGSAWDFDPDGAIPDREGV